MKKFWIPESKITSLLNLLDEGDPDITISFKMRHGEPGYIVGMNEEMLSISMMDSIEDIYSLQFI